MHEGTAEQPEVPGSERLERPKVLIRERGGKANISPDYIKPGPQCCLRCSGAARMDRAFIGGVSLSGISFKVLRYYNLAYNLYQNSRAG